MTRANKIQKAKDTPKAKANNKKPAAKPKAALRNEEIPVVENENPIPLQNGNQGDNGKAKAEKLIVGSWISSIIYNKVIGFNHNYVKVINQYGTDYEVSKDLIDDEAYSADQFTLEKKVTRTELAELLETAGDTVFTVNFITKATEDKAKALLAEIKPEDLANPKFVRDLAKNIIQGHESTIVGHLRNSEPKMGRSSVIDLNLPKFNNIRYVDHRSINWLIYKNVKYVAK